MIRRQHKPRDASTGAMTGQVEAHDGALGILIASNPTFLARYFLVTTR
jgi:hypothetical protein